MTNDPTRDEMIGYLTLSRARDERGPSLSQHATDAEIKMALVTFAFHYARPGGNLAAYLAASKIAPQQDVWDEDFESSMVGQLFAALEEQFAS